MIFFFLKQQLDAGTLKLFLHAVMLPPVHAGNSMIPA